MSKFYRNLENGEKGQFTAYVSTILGDAPFTWQKRFLGWIQEKKSRRLSPIIEERLNNIIINEEWKHPNHNS